MMEFTKADRAKTKGIFIHLIEAWNEYMEAHAADRITHLEEFMAIHNFHVFMVLEIEKRLQVDHHGKLFIRQMATDTFKRDLETRP